MERLAMKACRLPVAAEIASAFEAWPAPDGFSVVWERYIADDFGNPGVEYLITGPFPDPIADGDQVGLLCSVVGSDLALKWLDAKGAEVGDEMIVGLT